MHLAVYVPAGIPVTLNTAPSACQLEKFMSALDHAQVESTQTSMQSTSVTVVGHFIWKSWSAVGLGGIMMG